VQYDQCHVVRRVFSNLCVGNNDSHVKNLSIFSVPGQGVRLTPFYDLMCTRLDPGPSTGFAFEIGGEVRPRARSSHRPSGRPARCPSDSNGSCHRPPRTWQLALQQHHDVAERGIGHAVAPSSSVAFSAAR